MDHRQACAEKLALDQLAKKFSAFTAFQQINLHSQIILYKHLCLRCAFIYGQLRRWGLLLHFLQRVWQRLFLGFKLSDSKLEATVQAMCCLMIVQRLESKKSKTRKQEYVFSSAVRLFRYRNISCPSHECVFIRITAKAQSLFSRCSYPRQQDAVSHFIQSLIVCAILDQEMLWTFIQEVVITDIQGIDPYNNIQIINKS